MGALGALRVSAIGRQEMLDLAERPTAVQGAALQGMQGTTSFDPERTFVA